MTDGRDPIPPLDELGQELRRALSEQPAGEPRRRRRLAVAVVCAAFLGASGIAVAAGVVSAPWQTDEPAGAPELGRFELKARANGQTYATLVWRADSDTRSASPGDVCIETGPERDFERYPVREGGSCFDPEAAFAATPVVASRSTRDGVAIIDGVAGPRVERIVVEGPGGSQEAEISDRSRAFLTVWEIGDGAEQSFTVIAALEDGSRHTTTFAPPPPPERREAPRFPLTEAPAGTRSPGVEPRVGDSATTFSVVVADRDDGVYELRLSGPGGRDCTGTLSSTFGIHTGRIDSTTGLVRRPLPPQRQNPLLPSDDRDYDEGASRGPWCVGTYRLTGRFSEADGGRSRLPDMTFEVR